MNTIAVTLRYHQQDAIDFCGEAVAQMLIASLRLPVPGQATMRAGRAANSGTTPAEMRDLLNAPLPAGSDVFVVRGDANAEDGVRRIFTALTNTGVAIPVAVFAGTHWVAVTGAVIEGGPQDAAARIHGFFVHDPEPQAPAPAPNPHSDADPCGQVTVDANSQYGSANTFITMFDWLKTYWPVASTYGGQPVFVSIARDGTRDPILRGVASTQPAAGKTRSVAAVPKANAGVGDYGLADPGSPLAALIAGAVAGPGDVFPVDLIAAPAGVQPYHIVSLRRNGALVALARIGAADGRFLSLQAPPASLPEQQDLHDFALAALERDAAAEHSLVDWSKSHDRRFTLSPNLVWRASRQSSSPFYPFVQISASGKIVYATMDGRIHTQIEDHPVTAS